MVAFTETKEKAKTLTLRGIQLLGSVGAETVHLAMQMVSPVPLGEGQEQGDGGKSLLEQIAEDLTVCRDDFDGEGLEELSTWFKDLGELDEMLGGTNLAQLLTLRNRQQVGRHEEAELLVLGEKAGAVRFQTDPWPLVVAVNWDPGKEEQAALVFDIGCFSPAPVVSERPDGGGQRILLPSGPAAALHLALYLFLQSHA